jgi:hypothetical protein
LFVFLSELNKRHGPQLLEVHSLKLKVVKEYVLRHLSLESVVSRISASTYFSSIIDERAFLGTRVQFSLLPYHRSSTILAWWRQNCIKIDSTVVVANQKTFASKNREKDSANKEVKPCHM